MVYRGTFNSNKVFWKCILLVHKSTEKEAMDDRENYFLISKVVIIEVPGKN